MPTGRPRRGVTEEMAERGFMAAAQHNRDRPRRQHLRNDLAQRLLARFEIGVAAHIAEVEQTQAR